MGSPPRMRGKLYRAAGIAEKYRITPADAGKTYQRANRRDRKPDHPRGCGENHCTAGADRTGTGSPPRMRGKRKQFLQNQYNTGITPADAGKTRIKLCGVYDDKDHPRGCGEN